MMIVVTFLLRSFLTDSCILTCIHGVILQWEMWAQQAMLKIQWSRWRKV
jgi:hypothetical protein